MQGEKSSVYTIILGVCMLLCLLMIGRMLLGHPEQVTEPEAGSPTLPEQEETGMELRESDLCELIEQALPIPVREMTTKIGADQSISVVVLVSKQDLQESGLVPGGLRTALLFLPDEVTTLTDQVAASINEYFAQAGMVPEKLEWTDGAIRLTT